MVQFIDAPKIVAANKAAIDALKQMAQDMLAAGCDPSEYFDPRTLKRFNVYEAITRMENDPTLQFMV